MEKVIACAFVNCYCVQIEDDMVRSWLFFIGSKHESESSVFAVMHPSITTAFGPFHGEFNEDSEL